MLRIGIDVGGTNTDAVMMDGADMMAATKTATTQDVTSGIGQAIQTILDIAGVSRDRVEHVMIGTTQFTNAVIERQHLSKVAAIRLGLPAAACLPPMVDWPDDLRAAVGNHGYMMRGGCEYDGRILSDLDTGQLDQIADGIAVRNIKAVAITSIFGPVNPEMEKEAKRILLHRLPDLNIVLSSDIGRIGLLERESATILNAALLDLADQTVTAFRDAVADCGLTCGFSITQNDGTLIEADRVRSFPVLTFASGPTNSLRGASFLTGLRDAIVVDIGGTTSDVGSLSKGFPRQASSIVDIGGVRTNFRMPDVFAIGIGGGSLVSDDGTRVGPKSVGYRIADQARVFGGSILTATDIAVHLGHAALGDAHAAEAIDPAVARRAMEVITETLERAVDKCRLSADRIPVIAVGGGSILMPDKLGNLDVIRPENFGVANAVGAAIAQVSGEVDQITSLDGTTRMAALDAAEVEARRRAVTAGANAQSIEVIEKEDVPLAYLPGNASRIRVRVVGDMGMTTW